MRVIILALSCLALAGGQSMGQVVINEALMQTATGGFYQSEWVELYNAGAVPVDLAGWQLQDDPYAFTMADANGSLILDPGGYLLIWGRLQVGGYAQGADGFNAIGGYHEVFIGGSVGTASPPRGVIWLSNTGDDLLLVDDAGQAIDWFSAIGTSAPVAVTWPVVGNIDPRVDESVGRCPDMAGDRLASFEEVVSSPGTLNDCTVAIETPTPAPTSTETPTMTSTPAPTATPDGNCCRDKTVTFAAGWNMFSFPGRPVFGYTLEALRDELEWQGITEWCFALWEQSGWWIRCSAVPLWIPPTKMVEPGKAVMIFIPAPADFIYTYCFD